jgi:putative membrane protein
MAQIQISEDDRRLVSDAVAAAEARTSGEIVTIIADRSDGYTDIALAWSAAVSFTALAVVASFPTFYFGIVDWVLGLWSHDWTPREILSLGLGIATLKFVGMLLLQLWQPLKFFLVPGPLKTARVHDRAMRFFRVGAERRTTGRTGILIYLSMREHRAEIVADEAIAGRVEPEVWGAAMAAMLAHIKDGRIGAGMAAAVGEVGTILAQHLPRADDDQNELPDRLIEV